jgi:IPT/TIG domain
MEDGMSGVEDVARRAGRPSLFRRTIRTGVCVAVLVPVALVAVTSALAVTITSFSGTIGRASDLPYCYGSTITILGSGFVNDGGITSVTVGGVPAANVIIGSDSTIYALIGPGATSGPVVVTTKAGTATAPGQMLIYPCASGAPAALPAVSNAPLKARDGKKIELIGSGFIGVTGVTVGGVTAAYAIPSDVNMYIVVPATAGNAKNGKAMISITNAKGTVNVPIVLLPKS